MSGQLLARRTLRGDDEATGAIELLLDSDGASFVVRTVKGKVKEVVHWGPDRDAAIGAMNSQIDLAWRTLWTVHHRRPDGIDLMVTAHEINQGLLGAMPAGSFEDEVFG